MNWMLLIVTIFLDLPFLYFRARIEEEILSKELKGYKEYMNKTGMFLPKL
jgi:protein-S-isoprenylcysteine O-methyltransferase Ste14